MSFEAMREQLVSENTAERNAKNKLNSGKLQNALMKDLKVLKVPQMNSNQVESMIKKNGQNFSMLFPEKFDKYKVDDVVRR